MGSYMPHLHILNSDFEWSFKPSNSSASTLALRYPVWAVLSLTLGYMLIFIFGIVGNGLVIVVVARLPRRLQTATNLFVCNLAIADFLVITLCVPPNLASNIFIEWVLGHYMCKTVPYIQGVSVFASVYTLLAISVERLMKFRHPFTSYVTRQKTCLIVLLIWTCAFLLPIPWTLFFQTGAFYPEYPRQQFCVEVWPEEIKNGSKYYFLFGNFIICFTLPFTIIFISYLLICRTVSCPVRESPTLQNTQSTRRQSERIFVMKTLLVMSFIFFITWLPLYCITLRMKFSADTSELEREIIHYVFPIAQLIGVLGSAINPFLYGLRKKEFIASILDMIDNSSGHLRHTTSIEEEDEMKMDLFLTPTYVERDQQNHSPSDGKQWKESAL